MPTYDYVCKFCDHAFEHFQRISEKLLRTCPECKRRGLERLFGTGSGIVFKGDGFYETDYKRKGKPGGDPKPGDKKETGDSGTSDEAGKKTTSSSDSANSKTKGQAGDKPSQKSKD
jgi:putative FmdB family regulatory protein